MKRTTVLIDESLLVEAQVLAAQQGRALTAVIREALREYLRAHQMPREISFAGVGRSSQPDTGGRDEQHLAAKVSPIEGWSPRRRPDRSVDAESTASES